MAKYGAVFYETEDGEKPVGNFLRDLKRRNIQAFKKCLQYIDVLEQKGLHLPYDYIRPVEGPVWELRPQLGRVEYRIFFGTLPGNQFALVSAYQKTWDKVPQGIKDEAAKRIREMQRDYA